MQWRTFHNLAPYRETLAEMQALAANIRAGQTEESIWLLEHPPLYTAGTSARRGDLVDPGRFPVHRTGRGGQYTYHGPGQRIAYAMLDLKKRTGPGETPDIRRFVHDMEQWLIDTLAVFGIKGERRESRVGVWVDMAAHGGPAGTENKIAALGIRVSRGVTQHGVSINLDPDLSHYEGIVPCGINEHGVTSLRALGMTASMADLDAALKDSFKPIFGD